MPIAIGVDIGGSHISSAAVELNTMTMIAETYSGGMVDNKASKKDILERWSFIINKTLGKLGKNDCVGIGIAMPGPFNYKEGLALFKRNDKYENLYKISVLSELPRYLNKSFPIRFLNDAAAFGIGGALSEESGNSKKILAVTLGTGFGAAFLENNIPIVRNDHVPEGGRLWDKAFLGSIADDYFSTRWFVSQYKERFPANTAIGVKEIILDKDFDSFELFQKFAANFSSFLFPFLKAFDADLLILGGSISKSHELFLHVVQEKWKMNNLEVPISIIENSEEAIIKGSSFLFDKNGWDRIKRVLPER